MARMLASSLYDSNHAICSKRCCRHAVFYGHHGRQNPRVRKIQRAKENKQWKREENI